MFDVALPHDPRLDAGVLIERMLRRDPKRYWFELDCRRRRTVRGRLFSARLAPIARLGVSLRVIHDAACARTHLALRPIMARHTGPFAQAIALLLYPLLFAVAIAIRRELREAAGAAPKAPERTVVNPARGARPTDAYAPTVLYVPLRAVARCQALRAPR